MMSKEAYRLIVKGLKAEGYVMTHSVIAGPLESGVFWAHVLDATKRAVIRGGKVEYFTKES